GLAGLRVGFEQRHGLVRLIQKLTTLYHTLPLLEALSLDNERVDLGFIYVHRLAIALPLREPLDDEVSRPARAPPGYESLRHRVPGLVLDAELERNARGFGPDAGRYTDSEQQQHSKPPDRPGACLPDRLVSHRTSPISPAVP